LVAFSRAFFLVSLLCSILILPLTVQATDYVRELPSTTIFFENFAGTVPSWHQNDDCTTGAVSRNTTIAFPGDIASLWINCRTSGQIEDAHFSFAYPPSTDYAGVSVWMTGGTLVMNDTASSGVASISIEYWDQDEHLEAKLDYSPRLCNWDFFYGAAGASATIIKMCVPTETQTAGPITPHIAQSWVPIKLVMQRSTDKWVSIEIADKTFTAADLEAKAAGGSSIRSISAVGAGWPPDVFGSAEFSVSSGSTTVDNSFHFAHLHVTDESPVPLGPIQFAFLNGAFVGALFVAGMIPVFSWRFFLQKRLDDKPHSQEELDKDASRGVKVIIILCFVISILVVASELTRPS